MSFLKEQFSKDWSRASLDEIKALKAENEERANTAEIENQVVVDHMPLWLNMTNTTRCNLQCVMCNQAYGKIEEMRMTQEVYEKVVKEFYPFLKTVQLTAIGEPLMTPQLPSKIDDMLKFGVKLEMVTNGVLMKGDSLLKRLAEVSELITISLDGARASTFNSIRPGADFDQIIQNIQRFNEFRFIHPKTSQTRLNFNYILMERNIRELADFVDIAADLGAQTIVCSHLVLYEKALEHEMLIHHSDLSNEQTALAAQRATERGIEILLPPPFVEIPVDQTPPEPAPEPVPDDSAPYTGQRCYFLWKRVYVGPNGEIVPCCLSGIEAIGSLQEHSFPDIWNSPRYQQYRKRVHTNNPLPLCKSCYLINRNPGSADFNKA